MILTALIFILAPRLVQVDFAYTSSSAHKVQLAGDFNAWSGGIDMDHVGDRWVKRYSLPSDGRIEYKFVVDNQWILDPKSDKKFSNGLGGENSVWEGPAYRSSVRDQTPRDPMLRSVLVVGGRKIVVYAPKNPAGLPVLLYGDGDTYEYAGKVQNVLQNLVEANKVRPAIVVLIPPINRMKEYGDDWKAYGDYVFEHVLPVVRSAKGASERAEDVFMGGSSMGGLIALRLAEEFPSQLAGGIECQSAALQWSALKFKFSDVGEQGHLKRIAASTKIWLDWGLFEEKLTEANLALKQTLENTRRPFGYKTTPEGHTWTAWRNRMADGLVYLLGSSSH